MTNRAKGCQAEYFGFAQYKLKSKPQKKNITKNVRLSAVEAQLNKMDNLYFVYILRCSDGSFYTGITNDLARRFEEHQNGINRSCYTFKRRPLYMGFNQKFNEVLQAIYFEKKIKGWTRAKKEALINGDADMLQILSECRNATHYKYNPNK